MHCGKFPTPMTPLGLAGEYAGDLSRKRAAPRDFGAAERARSSLNFRLSGYGPFQSRPPKIDCVTLSRAAENRR
jgi:hypothetical protein